MSDLSFPNRYLLWLVLPPAVVTIPLAFLFVEQVINLSRTDAVEVVLLLLFLFALAAFLIGHRLTPALRRLDQIDDASACLRLTLRLAIVSFAVAAVIFVITATLIIMPSPVGLAYFVIAALIVTFPGIGWAYAAGKRQLTLRARGGYSGAELSIGRMIAVIFLGSFVLSSAALIALISTRVTASLEQLDIRSSADRFQRVFETANDAAKIEPRMLDDLRLYIPEGYSLQLIDPRGKVATTGEPLTAEEVSAIRRMRNGDSTALVSPHVFKFGMLKDGSILVLSIPWAEFRNIPIQITLYTLIVALLTAAIFTAAAYLTARDITGPLQALRVLADEMAQGHFDVDPKVFSDDEVGRLASAFGETRINLSRLLGRVGGSGSTITDGVKVITGGTESLLVRSRDQAQLTLNSTTSLESVREGIRSVVAAADTVAGLTEDASSRALELQASAEQVARSSDHLFQSVEKTSASTTEMDATMREMSSRTEVLAGIGNEVLSFVTEMDSTVNELRGAAQTTAGLSRQVSEVAEAGRGAMARMADGITSSRDLTNSTAETLGDLQRSVGQISQILTVIEEITTRTNLLALNAAIIAAQAGEQGLGFGVVADEIRELAERTRGSTKEISAIIKAVQNGSRQAVEKIHGGVERVEANVQLAADATSSLTKIVDSAAQSTGMANKISRALEDQAAASRHLHEVTSRMSDHIVQIDRATREQAHGTELLAQEADRVREIAAQVQSAAREQSKAGSGIASALEKISEDARAMRDRLGAQMRETEQIAEAARSMLEIAQENDAIAREFNLTVQNLVLSGRKFESEVARFRYRGDGGE